jgi:hypothetical protein
MGKYEEYLDANEDEIKKYDRVRCVGLKETEKGNDQYYGIIREISDPDGDVDDEGRSIGIPPTITIHFNDGSEDTFSGYVPSKYYPALAYGHEFDEEPIPYVFEDIELDK